MVQSDFFFFSELSSAVVFAKEAIICNVVFFPVLYPAGERAGEVVRAGRDLKADRDLHLNLDYDYDYDRTLKH